MSVRLAIITDIHHGPDVWTKCGHAALGLTRQFVDYVNTTKPDAVIELGDRISDVDAATDHRHATEVAEVLAGIQCPRYHINGNHDLEYLSVAENAAILGQPLHHRVVRLGDWDLVLWHADARIHQQAEGRYLQLPADDLAWLQRTLECAERPQLVVSHIPVSPNVPVAHYYFERAAHLAAYPQAPAVRDVLANAKVPVVYLSGHVHWNTVTQASGVFYLSQQSLTEGFTTQGDPAAAWGVIELGEHVDWEVLGNDPLRVRFTPPAARWIPPLQRLAPQPSEAVS